VSEAAIADCLDLEIVSFPADSRLTRIEGFQRCSIVELRLPSSKSC
jgi:hypothetical protein